MGSMLKVEESKGLYTLKFNLISLEPFLRKTRKKSEKIRLKKNFCP